MCFKFTYFDMQFFDFFKQSPLDTYYTKVVLIDKT
jgi:hypothetical protein